MQQLLFCRHGQSQLNAENKYCGQLDSPLTDVGRQQAKQAAISLNGKTIDLIVASPLIRALETAQIIATDIGYALDKIIINDLFMERNVGELQGKPYSFGLADETLFTGLEPKADLENRAAQGIAFLRSRPEATILLVAHGSLGVALMHGLNIETDAEPLNATIMEFI